MQQFLKFITWRFMSLNMFQAPPRPSSGAYNCINSLWFYRCSVVLAALLVTTTLQGKTRGC
jgi:cytochrome b subunit of formate dehydrogenase